MTRKSRVGPSVLVFPVPRWCASVRLTMSSNRGRARVALCAVAASGLRPSRAVFNRLRPLPTVPVRALLAVSLRATSSKQAPRDFEPMWRVATNRHDDEVIITPTHVCVSSHARHRHRDIVSKRRRAKSRFTRATAWTGESSCNEGVEWRRRDCNRACGNEPLTNCSDRRVVSRSRITLLAIPECLRACEDITKAP